MNIKLRPTHTSYDKLFFFKETQSSIKHEAKLVLINNIYKINVSANVSSNCNKLYCQNLKHFKVFVKIVQTTYQPNVLYLGQ